MKSATALTKYVYSNYWAILPSYFEVMQEAFEAWKTNAGIDFKNTPEGETTNITTNNIAILSFSGTFHKKLTGLNALSGGISGETLIKQLEASAADPAIKGIVLALDTPGGTVDGVSSVVEAIISAKKHKPIITYADGLLASAGVWIGSTANAIVCDSMAQVGSIGTIMIHQEQAKAEETDGITSTVMVAGKYKGDGNRHEPLSDQAKTNFQQSLDYYYSMFVDHVASSRGVTIADCLSTMAEGRIFIGQQAKDAGLVDKIGNLETAINLALELGGYTVKEELKEALDAMGTEELISAISGHTALPEHVATAIDTVVESSEEVTIKKVELDTLTTSLNTNKESLDALTSANAVVVAELAEAKATILSLEASSSVSTKRESIVSQFKEVEYVATEEFVDILVAMDDPQPIISETLTLHNSKKALALGLSESTGISSSEEDVEITTRDGAVNAVMTTNPDMNITEAIEKAAELYPTLVK